MNATEPSGKKVYICMFVDLVIQKIRYLADHEVASQCT